MLIISHADFMEEMEPFADWKRMNGMPCVMADVEDVGNADDIKQYIQDEYDTGNLAFVLLVGDADRVPTSQSMGNDSDNDYTYVAGDDHYRLAVRRHRRKGRWGLALQLLADHSRSDRLLHKKRRDMYGEMGWDDWRDYEHRRMLIRFPEAYQPF